MNRLAMLLLCTFTMFRLGVAHAEGDGGGGDGGGGDGGGGDGGGDGGDGGGDGGDAGDGDDDQSGGWSDVSTDWAGWNGWGSIPGMGDGTPDETDALNMGIGANAATVASSGQQGLGNAVGLAAQAAAEAAFANGASVQDATAAAAEAARATAASIAVSGYGMDPAEAAALGDKAATGVYGAMNPN